MMCLDLLTPSDMIQTLHVLKMAMQLLNMSLQLPIGATLTLSLPSTSKTNTSVPSMFQGLLNIEGIWVQHRVSPEPFNLSL